MRDFEERKAEIFRRSEKRIQKRRRLRKTLSLLCIPILLIVTIGSTSLFLAMTPIGGKSESTGDAEMSNLPLSESPDMILPEAYATWEAAETIQFPAVAVSSFDGRFARFIDDPETVSQVKALLTADNSTESVPEASTPPAETEPPSASEDGYQIVLIAWEGSQTVYTLTENLLTEAATGASWGLDSGSLSQLQALLELPE